MPLNRPRCFGLSDRGRVRDTNEDQFLIADLSKSMIVHHTTLPVEDETRLFSGVQGQLLLVADGMGGHASGEVASQLSVETIAQHILHTMPWFFRLHHEHEDDLHEELKTAVRKCERVVDAEALTHPEEQGMGTTLTMAYVIWPRMFVVHVGDSRCYLFRAGQMEQITRDHTWAQMLVDAGNMSKESVKNSPLSHVLISVIGHGQESLRPEVYKTHLESGDTVLLCTDGLTDRLSNNEIGEILGTGKSEQRICQSLIDAANDVGGNDNITVIVSRYLLEMND